MKPTVSVIIVNYNAGKLLEKSVKSVINFPGVEVVVADNASKDGSFIELQNTLHAPNLILIDNGANIGFGKAVNQAVKKSHGEYVYLLNPDASLSKTALARMVETAKKYDDRAIIAPRLENPDKSPQSSCYRPQTVWNAVKEYWFGMKGSYSKYLPPGNSPQVVHATVAAAWLVPRSVWDELGGLSDRFFLYFEDLDMCDRASIAGIPVIYDPQAIVKHAHGVSSRTNPIVMKLFTQSARTYHGIIKKLIIDAIIRLRDFFIPPVSTKKITGIILTYTLFILTVASLGYLLLPERYSPTGLISNIYHSNFLLWSWANFDGEHYLNIAQNGYQTLRGQSEYAFFPLFPLLINLVSRTGLDLYLSAHLVIFASAVGFIIILLKWASKYTSNPLSLLWLVLLSPGAIFLSAIYTEPLFLLLTVTTFYFSDKKEWGRAALMAALATATRVNGIFLVLFLLIKSRSYRALIGLTGLFAYMYYLWQKAGDSLAFFHAQAGWQKSNPTVPWVTGLNYLRAVTIDFRPDLTHLVVAIEVLVTALLLYLLLRFWRRSKLDVSYKYYALGNLALPLATGSLGSMPRFSLALFPLFLMIPALPRRFRIITYSFYILTSIIGIILFTRGYWYA
ncbi:MAG: glycosyltransferase [bacterium]